MQSIGAVGCISVSAVPSALVWAGRDGCPAHRHGLSHHHFVHPWRSLHRQRHASLLHAPNPAPLSAPYLIQSTACSIAGNAAGQRARELAAANWRVLDVRLVVAREGTRVHVARLVPSPHLHLSPLPRHPPLVQGHARALDGGASTVNDVDDA